MEGSKVIEASLRNKETMPRHDSESVISSLRNMARTGIQTPRSSLHSPYHYHVHHPIAP